MSSTTKGAMDTASRAGLRVTPYEVLGYLIPGGTLVTAIFLFEHWSRSLRSTFHTPVLTALERFASKTGGDQWELSFLFLLALIGLVYVLGHIVASVSSFFIDRLLVWKGRDYPYVELLGLEPNMRSWVQGKELDSTDAADRRSVRKRASRGFYRGLVLWLNVLGVASYFYVLASTQNWTGVLAPSVLSVVALSFGCFLGASIVVKILHSTAWHKLKDGSPSRLLRGSTKFFANYYPAAYDNLANPFVSFLGTRIEFEDAFRKRYAELFEEEFGVPVENAGTDNYWFPYIYVREKSPMLGGLVEAWLLQYAFARNLSAALHLAFVYATASLALQSSVVVSAIADGTKNYHGTILVFTPLLFYFGSVIMLLRYHYLYRAYYTRLIFRGFVYLSHQRSMTSR